MIHVCFALRDETGYSAKFVGTAMLSMFENIFKPLPSITVHILHDNTLTADNRSKFSYLAGRYGQHVKFYNVVELCADKIAEINTIFPSTDEIPSQGAAFYKFLILQVLPADIERAIYIESNTIVNTDISELWRIKLGIKALGAVPALDMGLNPHTQDKIVADGFVQQEDYFNSGVLLMNLRFLRFKETSITDGMKFALKHKYFNLLDQTILNYCFSLQTVKLPTKFNQFVSWARRRNETVAKKIYQYTDDALRLEINEPFNSLWLEYFSKTPWFDVATVGKLYEDLQQVHIGLKKSMANISLVMNNKTRAFCVVPSYVDELKKIFNVRDEEEIILLENRESMQKLLDAMKEAQGKKIFFIMAQNFPFHTLTKAGFVFGRDFLNAMEFLSEEQGASLNSNKLIQGI